MSLTVRQRAETVATLRFIEIRLMETLARWVPTTALMEAKVLFGRHIWETAQHADILGKRTYELRAPLNLSLAPADEYVALLDEAAALGSQQDRVTVFYDALIPAVIERCRAYLRETDPLLDEPTVRILKRIVMESEAMIEESRQLRASFGSLNADPSLAKSFATREAAIASWVIGRRSSAPEAVNA